MELMTFVWIGLMVVFGILEAATVNMVSVWFVGGSLAGLIVTLLGGQLWVQIVACLIVASGASSSRYSLNAVPLACAKASAIRVTFFNSCRPTASLTISACF